MINNSSSSKKRPKIEWWKIAVFALGILLIAGAATYSLATRYSTPLNGILGKDKVYGAPVGTDADTNVPNVMGVNDLVWVQLLAAEFIDHDFFLVIMPGGDSDSVITLTNRVAEAAVKIEAKGVRVKTTTLSSDDPEFSITKERLAIAQLPAVLAFSPDGNGAILTGDITEGKLLQTYLVVSQPVCAPGCSPSPGCCPGK